jgi:hypothetical protein
MVKLKMSRNCKWGLDLMPYERVARQAQLIEGVEVIAAAGPLAARHVGRAVLISD